MDDVDAVLERIRVIIRRDLSKFSGQDDNATIRRCLIILYLARIHPLFEDLDARMYDNNPLLYFSGPKLEKVKREISRDWGTPIKFDRYRTARNKYEKCKSLGYVDIKKEDGNDWFFALTEKGLERCEEIVNRSYRKASSTDLSKVRVVAINNYLENTYFLALRGDGSYVLGKADNNLKDEGITENSLIEYEQKELVEDFGKLPFKCRIEHMSKDSVRILADDDSIPRIKDMSNTNIKDIDSESFRRIGAYALGKVRVSRVVPQLIKILNNRAEDAEVLAEVSMALGSIGGNDAVEALLHHQLVEHSGYALGELDDFELYDDCLQRYLHSLKKPIDKGSLIENHEAELLVYRAMGLKKDKRYVDMLRLLLHDSWPSIRGVAALAGSYQWR